MSNDYACRGPEFDSQEAATVAMYREQVRSDRRLVEAPYVFTCAEGHWHYCARWESAPTEHRETDRPSEGDSS